jgi:hypothetical protein
MAAPLLFLARVSRSFADSVWDSTPPNEALLPLLDVPLVEAVSALERRSFWLPCLLPLGRLDILFLLLVGGRYYGFVLTLRLLAM